MSRWYRAYEGTVTDAKLGEVALVAGCSRSVAIATWHALLESAAAVNDGGRFDATARRVAVILGEPVNVIEAVLAEMEQLGMVCGCLVSAWTKRQFESDNSTERSRKHRERKRNDDATLQGRDATPPYTESDSEINNNISQPPSPASLDLSPSRPELAAQDEDPETAYWRVATELERHGIPKSRSGQLFKLINGDSRHGLGILASVAKAKNPSAYLGRIVSELKAETAPDPPAAKPKKGEPAWVAERRAIGAWIEREGPDRWRDCGILYDDAGREVGW